MEEKRIEQKFLGKTLFTWTGWDIVETGILQFYDIEFPFESMKKFNGNDATLDIEGKVEIYSYPDDKHYEVLWSGYVTDIKEWNE